MLDNDQTLATMAEALARSADYRVLRRLIPRTSFTPSIGPTKTAILLDVETTGLDQRKDEVVELGMIKFDYLPDGRIVSIRDVFSSFNEPLEPIPPDVIALTGITNEMVVGHRIDEAAVSSFAEDAVIVIAHNAAFDRRFWRGGFLYSPLSIRRAALRISIEKQRAFAHRRLNSSPTPWGFSTTGIGPPPAIVGPHSMYWPNGSPKRGGSHYKLFWKKHGCRHGGCGQGTAPSRQRICSRTGVTCGAQQSSDDRGAGIATC